MTYSYKIKDRNTGKYCTGGRTPGFTKSGKFWSKKKRVEEYLSQFVAVPDNWEVEEFSIQETLRRWTAKSIHTPKRHAYFKLGPGFWPQPEGLVKGSPEWSEHMKKMISGDQP